MPLEAVGVERRHCKRRREHPQGLLAVGDGWGRLGGPLQMLEGVGEGVYVRKLREIPDSSMMDK